MVFKGKLFIMLIITVYIQILTLEPAYAPPRPVLDRAHGTCRGCCYWHHLDFGGAGMLNGDFFFVAVRVFKATECPHPLTMANPSFPTPYGIPTDVL